MARRDGPWIRSQTLPMFLARARAAGGDAAALARRFGLPDAVLTAREPEVPLRALQQLPDAVAELTGDPLVGLHIALVVPRGAYGLVEFSCRNAATMREACRRLTRYSALLNELSVYSLERQGSEGWLNEHIAREPLCRGRHANELGLAMFVRTMRQLAGADDWAPRRVWFAHPRPRGADVGELAAFFGTARVEFGVGRNGLAVDGAWLDRPLPAADAALLSVLDEQAQRLVAERSSAGDFWGRLREHIRLALRGGAPELGAVAAAVHLPRRTLQRRLADEGTTFSDLVEGVRRDLAPMYLANENLALGEVAFLLGYSDVRVFIRAFRRWTGTTPARYRAMG